MSARILVVEDEEALTTLLRYNLDAEGYDVETVARGDDADTRLKERVPDLIVLDWMLPGLSGIELCRRLRARPETRQLPIIMLTARGEESERVRGLATGADDYIVKPFSVPELLARVKGLLRRASPERLATVLTYMMEDPRNISFCIHLMFCAKNIERIGDHATNIAETVFYMIEGQQMLDKRPKGDMTTFATAVPNT